METMQRISPWVGRFVLIAATVIFTLISVRAIADPAGDAAASGLSFVAHAGMTNIRIRFGAFPLGLAIIALSCLLSRRRLFVGVRLVGTMIAVFGAVIIFGALADHTLAETGRLLIPEAIFLILSRLALVC